MNSVLSNLPLYFLSVFKAPKWVISRLEALRRAFFWKGGASIASGFCLVRWKTVCRNRKEGGLGVKDLESMNLALLAKWWWRYLSNKGLFWVQLINSLYYTQEDRVERVPHSDLTRNGGGVW